MNDIHTLVNFTIEHLKINKRFVWYNDTSYRDDFEFYFIIDGIKVYYTDNFDSFNDNPMLSSFIIFSTSDMHYVITVHKGIDFIKFFDYLIGYLGYDELVRYK